MHLVNFKQRQSGLAMVEFCIAVPVILLMLLATIELGRGFMQYNAMTKSIRDGAGLAAKRARATGGTTGVVTFSAGDRNRIRNLVVFGNVAGTGSPKLPGLTINNIDVTVPGGGDVAVAITYAYQPVFLSLPGFGAGTTRSTAFVFSNQITMRVL